MPNPKISRIKLPNNTIYDIQDKTSGYITETAANDTFVNLTTNQVIDGRKDFNTVPRARIDIYPGTHNLPRAYQELQYISSLRSSGVVNTQLAVNTSTHYAILRASLIDYSGTYGTIMGLNGSPQIAYKSNQWFTGQIGNNGSAPAPSFDDTIFTFKYSYNGTGDYYVNDNDTTLSRTGTLSLVFFSNQRAGGGDSAQCSIYIAEIYSRDTNELVYQLIPAKSITVNQVGFYETVNGVFYPGQGIEAGPEDHSGTPTTEYKDLLTASNFASVAFSGDYQDLTNRPYIPVVGNGTLTIQENGSTVGTFTANTSSNVTANITVPTKTSDITNDSGYLTGITSNDVITALGYTPYDNDNPAAYITINDVPHEVYWCTYGTTTYSDISTAISDGKIPYCLYDNHEYIYSMTSGNVHYFTSVYFPYIYILRYHENAPYWSKIVSTAETSSNKVTSISNSSTNNQYPSAKCVYDNIENVREVVEGKTATYVCNIAYNPALNSQLETVTTTGSLINIEGTTIPINDTKIGDTVYITDTNVPDRWISEYIYGSNLIDVSTSRIATVGTLEADGSYYLTQANLIGIWTPENGVAFNGESGKQYKMSGYIKSSSITTINIALGFRYSDGTISQCGTRGSYTDYTYVEGLSTAGKTVVSIGVYYSSGEDLYIKDLDIRDTDVTSKTGIVLNKLETVKPAINSISVNGTNIQPVLSNVDIIVPTDTAQLTNGAEYITLNDVPQELFKCTYGTTTYAQITQALADGKLPYVVLANGRTLQYWNLQGGSYQFSTLDHTTSKALYAKVNSANNWTSDAYSLEESSNKVTTLTASASNTEYPSAKAVYDNIEDIRAVAEGKTRSYVISDVTNPLFNSQNDTLSTVNPITDIAGNQIAPISMNIGDVVYVKETDVPDRWVSSINVDTASITNLTGTTWLFNDRIDLAAWASAGLDAFVYISFTDGTGTANTYMRRVDNYTFYYSSAIAWYSGGGWGYDDIRRQTVTFTGGTASTNTTFIDWVKANATLQSDTYRATFEKLETTKPTISSVSVNGTPITPVLENVDITVPTDTNDLTNGAGYITLGDVPQELYWCTYGTTTYAEITAALSAGKLPVCKYNSHIYIYTVDENSIGHIFALVKAGGTSNGSIIRVVCDTNNSWARYSVTLEAQNNRVTSVSSLSTNNEYPTAKAVYDLFSGGQELFWCTYGITTYQEISDEIAAGRLPVCYYNNKLYMYSLKEGTFFFFIDAYMATSYYLRINTSNTWAVGNVSLQNINEKTTTLSSDSTNAQYPSAKAVYDAIEEVREIAQGRKTAYVVSSVANPVFNNEDATIEVESDFTDVDGRTIALAGLHKGDVIYITETGVPDRWVGDNQTAIIPEGYTRLAYIEGTGTQYLDTGVIPTTTDISMDLDMMWTGDSSTLQTFESFGGFMATGNIPRMGVSKYSGKYMFGINATLSPTSPIPDNRRHVIRCYSDQIQQILYVDGALTYTATVPSSALSTNTSSIWFFARNSASPNIANMRLYRASIAVAGEIYDYVPCKNSNDEIGIYDLNHNTFFKSATATPFTAGPVMTNAVSMYALDSQQLDLDSFYTKAQTNTLLSEKQNVIDIQNPLPYSYLSDAPNLANVATSGSYNDLTNIPTFAAVATSGDYADLNNTPTIPDVTNFVERSELASVATSGSYTDLSNKPNIIADVKVNNSSVVDVNKIAQITVPTNTSDLTNNSGFITNATDSLVNYTKTSDLGTVALSNSYTDLEDTPNLATVATTGSYNDLLNKPINELYYCTYGTTTVAQINAAIAAGQLPVCVYPTSLSSWTNPVFIYCGSTSTYIGFAFCSDRQAFLIKVAKSNNAWSFNYDSFEFTYLKRTSAQGWGSGDASQINDQRYPSEKLVYETIESVRELAEGRKRAIVCSDVTNPALNSQADTVTLATLIDINGVTYLAPILNVGDTVYVSETDVPDRWVSSVEPIATITDLTDTTWVFNDRLNGSMITEFITFNLNYTIDTVNYTQVRWGPSYQQWFSPSNPSQIFYKGSDSTYWVDETYKTITVTGGTDATNTELVAFFNANATLQTDQKVAILSKLETAKVSVTDVQVNNTSVVNANGVAQVSLADVATSGDYTDLINTPVLADVATTGDYEDLLNTPTIPDVSTKVDKVTSTDNALVRFDGTGGAIQNNTHVTLDDNGNITTDRALILSGLAGSTSTGTSRLYFGNSTSDYKSYLASDTLGAFSLASPYGSFTFYSNTGGYNCLMTSCGSDLGRNNNDGAYAWKDIYMKGDIKRHKTGGSGWYDFTFPTKSGTFALLDDIPTINYPVTSVNGQTGTVTLTIPTDLGDLTNTAGYLKLADLATVASTGSYDDLIDLPTLPQYLSDLSEDSTSIHVSQTQADTWSGKQDVLTFDNTPTENSTNPVTSNGIYDAIENIREIAEGKTASYAIDDTVQTEFNSQNSSINLIGINFTDAAGNTHLVADLKPGDVFYVTQTDVPDRWVSTVGLNQTISSLANTVWDFNAVLTSILGNWTPINLNFTSNGNSYDTIVGYTDGGKICLNFKKNGSAIQVYHANTGWANDAYRSISITNGTDAEISNVITWLQANAIMHSEAYNATLYTLETAKVPITSVSVNGTTVTPSAGNVDISVPTTYLKSVTSVDRSGNSGVTSKKNILRITKQDNTTFDYEPTTLKFNDFSNNQDADENNKTINLNLAPYNTGGIWYTVSSSVIGKMANVPGNVASGECMLEVRPLGSPNYTLQIFTYKSSTTFAIWQRVQNNTGNWGNWQPTPSCPTGNDKSGSIITASDTNYIASITTNGRSLYRTSKKVSDFVTVGTSQDINGTKTFTVDQIFNNNRALKWKKADNETVVEIFKLGSDDKFYIGNSGVSLCVNNTLTPAINNTYDLGSSSLKWKDAYISGSVYTSTLNNGAAINIPTTAGTLALTSDLTDFIGKDVDDLENYSKTDAFADVAFSGDYTDLTNTPTIPTNSDYVDLTTTQSIGGQKTFTANRMYIKGETHFDVGGSPTDYAYGQAVGIYGKSMMCNTLYVGGFKYRTSAMNTAGKPATVWNLPNLDSGSTYTLATTSDLTNFITKSVNDLDNYTLSANLATVATSGSYNDLADKPLVFTDYIIPTV